MSFAEEVGRVGYIERTFREKIVLVGVTWPHGNDDETNASLDELALLVDTAGAGEVARVIQRRTTADPATYVGKGKVEEILAIANAVDADTVVFDDELTPAQQGNLEKLLGRSAIDRTAVILDIFAQNAHTVEGKAQVQLALLRYRLPRLRGKGLSLSQQAGGIGARRGPGETQLEVDRRRVDRLIHKLERDLVEIERHRHNQRKARQRSPFHQVSIVGYTNAGKSTLLNHLTEADVLVEDRLFATLDPTTRRLQLPGGEAILLTDTVGFVKKLPHQLVEAFKSTLEIVSEADLLIHLVDATAPDIAANIDAVRSVLFEIGADRVPEILVINKIDAASDLDFIKRHYPDAVAISAQTGEGIPEFLLALGDRLRALTQLVELMVPFDRGDVLARLHREGEVLSESTEEHGMRMRVRLDDSATAQLSEFLVE